MTIYSKITNKFFVRNNLKKAEKVEDLRVIDGITEETVDVFYINQNKAEVAKGTDGILDHISYQREQSAQRQLDKLLEVLYKLIRELDEDLNKLENKTIIQVELEQADSQPAKLPKIDSMMEKSEQTDNDTNNIKGRKAKETNFNSEPVGSPNKLKNIKTVDPQNNYSPKSKKDSVSSNKKVCLFTIVVASVLTTIIIAVYYSTLAAAIALLGCVWLVYNNMFQKTNGPNSTLEEPREEKAPIHVMESI
ncbi:hypothetical protein [Wolbachia endosymbiont of Tetranychus urticae]|uniref:hypothetical protein n=1 Tax=Wolbachia endosymbiont of Tetranychus urticae TaxID=169184 RepID=UPI00397DEFAB